MEASAINSGSQVTVQVIGVRVPTSSPRQAGENLPRLTAPVVETRAEATKQAIAQKKTAENDPAGAAVNESSPSVGRIRFELDDGTRVAKFFDTKDILIYQVPPEGSLYLVRIQETDAQDQIETSA